MTRGNILLPDGTQVDGRQIAWVADSNYQSEADSRHVLVEFDDALKRRFSVNLTLDYLCAEDEVAILTHIISGGYL
jgi:predicted proteasome-type protease